MSLPSYPVTVIKLGFDLNKSYPQFDVKGIKYRINLNGERPKAKAHWAYLDCPQRWVSF